MNAATISADGRWGLTGSDDLTVRLWELSEAKQVACLGGHTQQVTTVALSPDGRFALSGGYDDLVRIFARCPIHVGEVISASRKRTWHL